MGMPSKCTNNFTESGRGLGHVTHTIFGSTVGYPSDSLASCFFFGTKPVSPTFSEMCNGDCDAMVDMTLNDAYAKVKVISFWYQSIPHARLPIEPVNSNFCSRTHRLATIHTYHRQTDDRQTDATV